MLTPLANEYISRPRLRLVGTIDIYALRPPGVFRIHTPKYCTVKCRHAMSRHRSVETRAPSKPRAAPRPNGINVSHISVRVSFRRNLYSPTLFQTTYL